MKTTTLDPSTLLKDTKRHRLVLEATLKPVTGDRFQPAGFPEIGHVIYKAPREGGKTQEICIVDSAASMANHLETVMHDSPQTLGLHSDLAGMPYVELYTDSGWPSAIKEGPHRLVLSTLSEGHRLASSIFVGEKAVLVEDGKVGVKNFGAELINKFGMLPLGKRMHPQPGDWWNIFNAIFHYDPNSLVHGILFPALGIKIPRLLTGHHEALGAGRVETSGVKFDKLQKTNSGQPIFTRDEETADEIRATFVIDLAQLRSFGRGENGLSDGQKEFLLRLALWKIGKLLSQPFRYRSGCDLELVKLIDKSIKAEPEAEKSAENAEKPTNEIDPTTLNLVNTAAIDKATFRKADDKSPAVTKVYWKSDELFKETKDTPEKDAAAAPVESPEDN